MATEFHRSSQRWGKLGEMCGMINANIEDASQRISASENYNEEQKIKWLEQMKKCALNLARIDAEAKGRKLACEEMSKALTDEARTDRTIENPMAMFQRGATVATESGQRPQLKKAPEVMAVQSFIDRFVSKDGDDDEVQVDISHVTQHVTKCPVTGKSLETPVKSTLCGHVYSLEGVIQYFMQRNRNARMRSMPTSLDELPPHLMAPCAYAGCNHNLTKDTLKRDFATELSQRQRRNASSRRDSMDADIDEVEIL